VYVRPCLLDSDEYPPTLELTYKYLYDNEAGGLLLALMNGWQLQPGQTWQISVTGLRLRRIGPHTGWYEVQYVAPVPPAYEVPELD